MCVSGEGGWEVSAGREGCCKRGVMGEWLNLISGIFYSHHTAILDLLEMACFIVLSHPLDRLVFPRGCWFHVMIAWQHHCHHLYFTRGGMYTVGLIGRMRLLLQREIKGRSRCGVWGGGSYGSALDPVEIEVEYWLFLLRPPSPRAAFLSLHSWFAIYQELIEEFFKWCPTMGPTLKRGDWFQQVMYWTLQSPPPPPPQVSWT